MEDLELERVRKRLLDANDVLIVNELRNFLVEQQNQNIAIEELRGLVRTLSAGMIATIDQIDTLQRSVLMLTVGRDEMLNKQESLARLCDALAESIRGKLEP